MTDNFELIKGNKKKELESLLMIMNGIVSELEYSLDSGMDRDRKFSKILSLLDEIKEYSDKIKKLIIRVKE